MINITIIIPTYKDWGRLRLCVDALEKQSIPQDHFEVILVNNAPGDRLPPQFMLRDNVCLIHEPMPGSYAARNAGLKVAKGDILVFTDSDCIPDKDWLKNALACFEADSPDLIGGRVKIFKEKGGNRLIYTYEKYTSFRQEINVPKGNGITANLFVKKSVIDQVGRFNPDIKSGGDREFTSRCVHHGYRFAYCEKVTVHHPARRNFKELLVKQKRLIAWDIINKQQKFGHSKTRIVSSQIKNGLFKLFTQKYRKANFLDKTIINLVEFIKITYRISIGLLILFHLIDPVRIRK